MALDIRDELRKAGIEALFPGSAAYLSPTPRNKRMTVYPEGITFPTSPEQVAKIVEIGKKCKRRVVALSGGHGSIANSIGGTHGALVIDLGKLKKVDYDPVTHRITFQTGCRLRDVHEALQKYNRAFAHGICFDVGLGGHPSFGGFGFASRMWGLNCDAIHSMNVVTDDGTLKVSSADSHPDLFWAMRGAAPSFAIATSLTYNTHPAPEFAKDYQYIRMMTYQEAATAVLKFQEAAYTDLVPKELGFQFRVDRGKEANQVALTVRGTYYGPEVTFHEVIEPFLKRILGIEETETTRISDANNEVIPFPPPDPNTFFSNHYAATISGDYFTSNARGAADPTLTGDSVALAKAIGSLVKDVVGLAGDVVTGVVSGLSGTPAGQFPGDIPEAAGNLVAGVLGGVLGIASGALDIAHTAAKEAINLADHNYVNRVISPGLPKIPQVESTKPSTVEAAAARPVPPDPSVSFYIKSLMSPVLNEAALVAFMKYAARKESSEIPLDWYVAIKLLGGKDSAIPTAGSTSFGWRNAFWFIEFNADARVPPPYPEYGYTFLDDMVKTITSNMPGTTFGAYPGFRDNRLENFNDMYYGVNYTRLKQIKATSATNDVFVFPQSI